MAKIKWTKGQTMIYEALEGKGRTPQNI